MTTERVTIGNATLFCGDCIELLPEIPNSSVDAIVVDPPFFQGFNHNGSKSERADLSIGKPFFNLFFGNIERVCKEERAVYVFCDWRTNGFFLDMMNDYVPVRNTLVWIKHIGTGSFYQNSHELILFHCNTTRRLPFSNVITGVKSFNGGAKVTNGDKVHPTQKPVELIAKFITDSTQQGMTVLDPMMGSGTTGVACANMGRAFIGIEQQRKYFDIACKRIEKAYAEYGNQFLEVREMVETNELFTRTIGTIPGCHINGNEPLEH
ncbi:MAG: site-specific DNA-methyltransferase [Planctomycetaceae bacterium]|nr:site-specific DNA-methyltransferase [Planctomycetaceae bacterium]